MDYQHLDHQKISRLPTSIFGPSENIYRMILQNGPERISKTEFSHLNLQDLTLCLLPNRFTSESYFPLPKSVASFLLNLHYFYSESFCNQGIVAGANPITVFVCCFYPKLRMLFKNISKLFFTLPKDTSPCNSCETMA